MKVILLKDIKGLGRKYEEKTVSDGYALNMLIPRKMAVSATGPVAGQIKSLKEGMEKHKEADMKKLEAEVAKLAGTTVTTKENANNKGSLFAALSKDKISQLLKGRGIDLTADHIDVSTPIKETGTFSVPVLIGTKQSHFTLIIEAK